MGCGQSSKPSFDEMVNLLEYDTFKQHLDNGYDINVISYKYICQDNMLSYMLKNWNDKYIRKAKLLISYNIPFNTLMVARDFKDTIHIYPFRPISFIMEVIKKAPFDIIEMMIDREIYKEKDILSNIDLKYCNKAVFDLLLTKNVNIDKCKGGPAIDIAYKNMYLDSLQFIISQNINIDLQNLLFRAISDGNTVLVKLFMDNGARLIYQTIKVLRL